LDYFVEETLHMFSYDDTCYLYGYKNARNQGMCIFHPIPCISPCVVQGTFWIYMFSRIYHTREKPVLRRAVLLAEYKPALHALQNGVFSNKRFCL
jgi:hypothetical protein